MSATVFLRVGWKRDSLDVLPRNTRILVEKFCAFIRAVENTVGIHAALVALGEQIHQGFHDMFPHIFISNRLVHHKGQPKLGVLLRVAESLIVKGKGQTVVTADSFCILHAKYRLVSPEAAEGGPIALIEEGDLIRFDIEKREINIIGFKGEEKSDEEVKKELKRRKELWIPKKPKYTTGVISLYSKHAVSPMKGGYME